MFIPLRIRHSYNRLPIGIWSLAMLVGVINLFFLLVPGWVLDIDYEEILRFSAFDRDQLHDFNFVAYAFFYPNPYLFVFDMVGLLFFGTAVESRLGIWRTLILFLAALPFAAFFHGLYQPSADVAGMTGGVLALVGAAVLVYGFSETDGIALLPIPPNYRVGLTYTWTIFLILGYLLGAFLWAYFAPRDSIQILGPVGLASAFLFGMGCCALLIHGQIPILRPKELDPSTIKRMQDQERREEVGRQLQEDGLFSQNTEEDFFSFEPPSAKGEQGLIESPGSSDIDLRKQSLAKMVMLKNAADLAQAYQQFVDDFPHACMASGPQFDLAVLLEKSFFTDSAIHAYERLIQCHPHSPAAEKALLNVGRLLAKTSGRENEGIRYLERFIQTEPARHDLQEANEIIRSLREGAGQPASDDSVQQQPVADSGPINLEEIDAKPEEEQPDVSLPADTEIYSVKMPSQNEEAESKKLDLQSLKKVRIGNVVFTKSATPMVGRKFTLLVTPKAAIDMQVLAEVFAGYWGETEAAAIERLRKGKGIVEQGLSEDEAKMLLDRCSARGQRLLKALESYDLSFSDFFESESIQFKDAEAEWRGGMRAVEAAYEQVRMISAALVRVSAGSTKVRCLTSVYVNTPRVVVCMWDSLLRVDDPALRPLSPRDALKAISARLSDACPQAMVTHSFHRTFEASTGQPLLVFETEEEFFNYNRWNLFVEEYWQKIV
jgi:tetratricopeptide (TPR) repeat protein